VRHKGVVKRFLFFCLSAKDGPMGFMHRTAAGYSEPSRGAAMNLTTEQLHQPVECVMSTELLCVYEGWSIERLRRFLNRYNKVQAPVIAADHQLVGVVDSGDIEHFLGSDETRRAQAVNQRYRLATGANMDNLDELTAWTRRAEHYCTVHQIMRAPVAQVETGQPLEQVLALLLEENNTEVYVVQSGVLMGSINAHQLLRCLFTPQE